MMVGEMPRYKAKMPPSVAVMCVKHPKMVLLCIDCCLGKLNLVLTMSSGYVQLTEATPAIAPQTNLSTVRSAPIIYW